MAVSTEHTKDILMGDGINTKFPFTFQVIEPEQVKCLKVLASGEEIELLRAEFEVRLINDGAGGGEVTYPLVGDPLETGDKLVIHRRTEIKQDYTPPNGQSFDAVAIRTEIDRLTMQNQEQEESLSRSVQTSMGSEADPADYLENVNEMLTNARKLEELAVKETEKNLKEVKEQVKIATDKADEATTAVDGFDEHVLDKQGIFDDNAASKTTAFNENAASKQAAVDASAYEARQSELKAEVFAQRVRSEGIPMSVIEQKRIEKNGNAVSLRWQDPRDTIIDGYVLASWKSTTIVKKQGSWPEDADDGVVVEIVTTRNKYLNNPLVDIQENADEWYYRAFPLSVNGVYSLDKRNSFGVVLFGYRINEVDPVPSTRVEYLPYADNYFYDPCVMDFMTDTFNWGTWRQAFFVPKPCALSYAGNVDYYLNPDDFTKKADGSASDVSNSAYGGNFMCEFPVIYAKVFKENNYINVLISNVKLDEEFECWSCKKADGSYSPNFYLPMFEGTNIDNKLRSIATTGKPTSNTSAETEATLAMANGTGWNTTLWADEMLMMLLFPLLFKSTDSQTVLGQGASGSTSGLTCNNNAAVTRGMMYGTKDRSAAGLTFLGLHNWHGHRWRRCNGLMNANGNIKVKMTHSTIDGSTVTGFNRTGNGYISTGFVPPAASESYISRFEPLGGGKYGIVPKVVSGSSSTYYCDAAWTNNGQLDQLILGGSVNDGSLAGAFCFSVNNLPTNTHWNVGASPSYRHL